MHIRIFRFFHITKLVIAHVSILTFCQTSWSGSVVFSPKKTTTFHNLECEKTNSCDLESLTIETKEFRAILPNDSTSKNNSFGTSATFQMKTKNPDDLKKYVFVQFIRGCYFQSSLVPTQKLSSSFLQKKVSFLREYFDQNVLMKHPTWMIDSVDSDPVYNNPADPTSTSKIARNGLYRFIPASAPSLLEKYEKFFYQQMPDRPILYVTDIPGTAWFNHGEAKNISFQFQMCIFRESDVPVSTSPDGLKPENALLCGNWASSYIFDFKKEKFQSLNEIDPICTSEENETLDAFSSFQ